MGSLSGEQLQGSKDIFLGDPEVMWRVVQMPLQILFWTQSRLDSIVEKKERKQAIRMELGGMTSSSGNVSSPSVGANIASATRASGSGGHGGVGIHSYFQPQTTPGSQPSIISMLKKKEKKEADLMLAKLIYYEGVPINITRSIWWQPTIDDVANAGPGYVAPTYAEMQGPLMKDLKEEVRER